jgi:ComF family protein
VGEELGKLLIDVMPLLHSDTEKCVLCPVPLHWSREFYRGFNQAEQLATILSNATNIPVVHCLKRVRSTPFQARKKGAERRQAMHDMFRCILPSVPSQVILIDDILTTGATMDACAKVLKDHGTVWVGGLVLAKG